MARQAPYKQYTRDQRRSTLESDLSKGMMSSTGAMQEGYLKSFVNCRYEKETLAITPRPGLRLSGVVFPNSSSAAPLDFRSDDITIKDSKQCVEDGVTYNQIILGKLDDEDPTKGLIWVLTSSAFLDQTPLEFTSDYTAPVTFASYLTPDAAHTCYFYSVDTPSIHNVFLTDDVHKRIEFPVGSFAYGNHYYFIGEDSHGNKGMFRTFFDTSLNPPRYSFEVVDAKDLSVSEAVAYGYNMLLGNGAYTFTDKHSASLMEFDGILPYDRSTGSLLMYPKKNQPVRFRCYYDAPDNTAYKIVWEWRETTSADWTMIQQYTRTLTDGVTLECDFKPPAVDMMVRVVAYRSGNDDVEKAIVVGFDFSRENYGTARPLEQKVYDLMTATGMEKWKDRLALWGLPEDPTILFLGDYNEPSYFPYPNNIITFDEPIIYAIEFMDNLVVFTTSRIYQVSVADDGSSWKTTVLQSHLSIDPWDKHLIQTVRNMLYFKSGNYYYMMVPKAQSLTGELTLAPITTPITSFFDTFSVSVQELLQYTYGFTGNYELLTYYNFLDYEDVHNIYAYKFDDSYSIMHFDVIYNTVDRTWKVWIYESPNLMYPIKQEATRSGLLASTSLIQACDIVNNSQIRVDRIVQIFCWDKMLVRSCYIPEQGVITYDSDGGTARIESRLLHFNENAASIQDHLLTLDPSTGYIDGHTLYLQDSDDYYIGYSKHNILQIVRGVYDSQDEYYTFRNYQFIDTGYRDDDIHTKKRYREIQLLINNLDKKNMQFGMDYVLDGAPRRIFYKYDVAQTIDEFDPEYGVVYIDSTPYMETELNNIDLTNQWTLDQDLIPEVALWKVRVAVSGKGYAPRLRLYSRNEKRFELLSVNWISKLMNMR
jgi:hypothetical protein